MYIKIKYTIYLLGLIFITTYSKVLNKKDVLNIKNNGDINNCPDYSNGDIWYLDRCAYSFYCKDDICVNHDVRNHTIEIPDKEGKIQTYITDICLPSDLAFNTCYSDMKCNSDSECLSNKCIKNHCITNDDSPIVHCQDAYHYYILTFKTTYDMRCGRPDGDKCEINEDCSSDVCIDKICQFQGREHYFDSLISYIFYGFIFILLGIIFCCICCCNICRKPERGIKHSV